MSMKINLLVTGGLYTQQSGYSAWRFCQAALQAGHQIRQVFFYQDGVTQGSALAVPLSDEFNMLEAWIELAERGVELIVCVSAAERRGMISQDGGAELDLDQYNLHPVFKVAGLGVLHQTSLDADRTVTFK